MKIRYLIAPAMVLFVSNAWAHGEGAHSHTGLMAGLAHPFGGLDHLLAMLAVGMWAVQLGGRAWWILPAAFVGSMAMGSLLGATGVLAPAMEAGIVFSVLVLGLLVAARAQASLMLAATLAAGFALFHGAAHGLEMPLAVNPLAYAVGMLSATAMLHAGGVVAGISIRGWMLRVAGAGVALAGLGLALA